ncbi:MAG: VCBS repeat-containing protein [Acidobacteria bacterium]|nr:VCBS repeat-containing protein [Acidobacteriota bacterium]
MKNYTENLRSLFMIFAVLVTVLWCGANITTTNAQTPTPTPRRVPMDFTGDGRSDWATVVIGTVGTPIRWKVTGNPASTVPNQAFIRAFDYGFSGDFVVPADYNGDRKTDVTVWRPGTPGIFYVAEFPTGTGGVMISQTVRWGAANDRLVFQGGDYDGDGKADYTVVRVDSTTGNLTWFIKSSSAAGTERAVPFGTRAGAVTFFIFPGADFTGDGRDELVFATVDSSSLITYFIGDSITGAGVLTRRFGDYDADNTLAPGDYTGDGRADFVAVRQTTSPATWFINDSATNTTTARPFGIPDPAFAGNADIPVRGDYDGDGKFDIAVFRRSNATFYYLTSSNNNGTVSGQKAGDPGDGPLAGLAVNF